MNRCDPLGNPPAVARLFTTETVLEIPEGDLLDLY